MHEAPMGEDARLFANDPVAFCQTSRGHARIRMPNGLSRDQLRAIGRRGARVLLERFGVQPLYLIGVASRGLPIAAAITLEVPHEMVILSIIQNDWLDDKVDQCRQSHQFIIIDNTIRTGRTLLRIAGLLHGHDIQPRAVLTFCHEELDLAIALNLSQALHMDRSGFVRLYSPNEIARLAPDRAFGS
jgi:adenine/guanine phosphoribosyltransferase-like PRPP-binding protein